MAALEQLQGRIAGLEELRGIVKTMKALSGARIRQYEQAVIALEAYHDTVEQGLQVVLRDLESGPAPAEDEAAPCGAIVFGSDHGLCGRFNEDLAELAGQRLGATGQGTPLHLVGVGARASAAVEQRLQAVELTLAVPGAAARISSTVQRLLGLIDQWRTQQGVRRVLLFYNRRAGTAGHEPIAEALLPLDLSAWQPPRCKPWPSRCLPGYTMERRALLRALLQQFLFTRLFRAAAQSQSSEHASRLAAMQAAQRNLDERLEDVTAQLRRARQSTITAELLDVVSGFEAITTPAGTPDAEREA